MKLWQKITGIVILAGIAWTGFWVWINALVDMKYMVEPFAQSDKQWGMVENYYTLVTHISIALVISLLFSVFLFICLWRKGNELQETKSANMKKEKSLTYWHINVNGEHLYIEVEEPAHECSKIVWAKQDGSMEFCGYPDKSWEEMTEAEQEDAETLVSPEFDALIAQIEDYRHECRLTYSLQPEEGISKEEFFRLWNQNDLCYSTT
ncbi:hypothetical protein [Prevotella sp. kh1p2]|uniref:hypothetical protein n=1 Tax=Prevotella sp. kh1p2 TaxID=1761883 RepID=UPI0008C50F11|nr:hypothetical protein [Prevotella sp. kh1p2]SES62673.1 hypothetical protein SAMN04487825_10148 [Prevotella sp. kh1p2]SNU10206.1 hypothetical protein SAMN06298210_101238 [Prevotellaceae bacterium KH2P17]